MRPRMHNITIPLPPFAVTWLQYAAAGIHVQCQSPYFVTTKLSKLRHASLFTPTPATYVSDP